jgi:hypothetical protein
VVLASVFLCFRHHLILRRATRYEVTINTDISTPQYRSNRGHDPKPTLAEEACPKDNSGILRMDHEKSVYQANAVSFAFSQGKNQGTPRSTS